MKGEIADKNTVLDKANDALDEALHLRNKDAEPKKAVEIEDEAVLAKLDSLQNEIDTLRAEDETINRQEISDKQKLHGAIKDTAKKIAKLKASGKDPSQQEDRLKRLMKPKPLPERKGFTTKVQNAQKRLKERSDKLWEEIKGKTDAEKNQIRAEQDKVQQALKELNEQNSRVWALNDKVERIKAARDEATTNKDSASE